MNRLVLVMFAVLLVMSSLLSMGEQIWLTQNETQAWYIMFISAWPDLGQGFAGWIVQVSSDFSSYPDQEIGQPFLI
jgi:hypothetical protein